MAFDQNKTKLCFTQYLLEYLVCAFFFNLMISSLPCRHSAIHNIFVNFMFKVITQLLFPIDIPNYLQEAVQFSYFSFLGFKFIYVSIFAILSLSLYSLTASLRIEYNFIQSFLKYWHLCIIHIVQGP